MKRPAFLSAAKTGTPLQSAKIGAGVVHTALVRVASNTRTKYVQTMTSTIASPRMMVSPTTTGVPATTKEAAPAPANKTAGNGRLHKTRTRPGRTGARFTRTTVATRTRTGRTGAHGQRSPQDKTNKHRGRNGPSARPSTSRARDGRLHPQRPGRHGRVRGRRLIPSPIPSRFDTRVRLLSPIFSRVYASCVSPRRNVPNRATWMFSPSTAT